MRDDLKPIKYPLEAFVWQLYDQNSNAQVEIRDANHNTVFFMRLNGCELQSVDRLKNELVPLVVELFNKQVTNFIWTAPEVKEAEQNSFKSNGNGKKTEEVPVKRGRGRPRKNW